MRWRNWLSVLAGIFTIGMGLAFNLSPDKFVGAILGFLAICLLIWRSWPPKYNKPAIERALEAIYEALELFEVKGARCTIWTLGRGNKLVQLVPYIPDRTWGGLRAIHHSKGAVGRCFRTRKFCFHTFWKEPEDFRRQMVEEWGFTDQEAALLRSEVRWTLAFPILDESNRVLGIFYAEGEELPVGLYPGSYERTLRLFSPFLRELLRLPGGE